MMNTNPLYHEIDRLRAELDQARQFEVILLLLWAEERRKLDSLLLQAGFRSRKEIIAENNRALDQYYESEVLSARIRAMGEEHGRIRGYDFNKELEDFLNESEAEGGNQ